MKNTNKHIGQSLDDFLAEEGLLVETEAAAIKRVIAYELVETMKKHALTKSALAERMKTSRAALERLLDPENTSITLQTLSKAARVMGKKLVISFGN